MMGEFVVLNEMQNCIASIATKTLIYFKKIVDVIVIVCCHSSCGPKK